MQISGKKIYGKMEKKVWKDIEALVSDRIGTREHRKSAYAWYSVDFRNERYKEDMEIWKYMDWRICECENDKLYREICKQDG
jgi:hypothetical protein